MQDRQYPARHAGLSLYARDMFTATDTHFNILRYVLVQDNNAWSKVFKQWNQRAGQCQALSEETFSL